VSYIEVIAAIAGVLGLAWAFDALVGKRGFGGALLVSGVGAGCGAFLGIRVFAVSTLSDWTWVVWALAGSALALGAYMLLRNKR